MGSQKTFTVRVAWVVAAMVAVALVVVAWTHQRGDTGTPEIGPNMQLSQRALAGKPAYDAHCAQCHGSYGAGTDKGPPLVHAVYNPGHHSDVSFARAVAQGVRQHHWRFGDMPAQPQVDQTKLDAIVRFVREVQQANGIVYSEHRM